MNKCEAKQTFYFHSVFVTIFLFIAANTKVEVRFEIDSASFINDRLKKLLKEKFPTRITKDGLFSVTSEKTRTQAYNLADCLDKIRYLIRNLEDAVRELTPDEQQILAARLFSFKYMVSITG